MTRAPQAVRDEMELVTQLPNVLTKAEPEVEIVLLGNYLKIYMMRMIIVHPRFTL